MIVLDGATSQWKRSDARQRRDRAGVGLAGGDPHERVEVAAHGVEVGVGRERAQRAPRRARRAPRGSAAGGRTARRRRSRTRRARRCGHDAHDRVLERARRHGAPPRPRRRTPRGGSSRRRRYSAYSARARGANQSVGHAREHLLDDGAAQPRREPRVGRGDVAGARQQHVVADRRERAQRLGGRVLPRVLQVERGAVVDQPQPAVPEQQVGVLRRAVDVGRERVEPDDLGGQLRVGRRARRRGCR